MKQGDAKWIEPMALVGTLTLTHRVETRCYKIDRAYGSDRVARRGVASAGIVTTDFNPLMQTIRGDKEP